MNASRQIREAVHALHRRYEESAGVGPDEHWEAPLYHPMAEGKYLSSLARLARARLLSASDAKRRVEEAVERLRAHDLAPESGLSSWGLGFPYKDAGPSEPYLITTSIVAEGLLDGEGGEGEELVRGARRWLERYPWRCEMPREEGTVALPLFSPATTQVVTNAVACWAATLDTARRSGDGTPAGDPSGDQVEAALAWVRAQYRAPVGWPYSPEHSRVDLLHQCYILRSLLRSAPGTEGTTELLARRTLSHFRGSGFWADKLDLAGEEDALRRARHAAGASPLFCGPFWVVRYAEEARDWSYGELLTLVGELMARGRYRDFWYALGRRLGKALSERVLRGEERPYPRHRMHLACGLSSVLASLRSPARGGPATDGA